LPVDPRLQKVRFDNELVDRLARAEEALQARELNFKLIVESIPVPVAVTTPAGDVEALNQPTLEYFGKTFAELKGWKTSDVVHPDDLQQTIATQLKAHQTGSAYNVESRHRRADGVYRWFNVRGFPLRDSEGHILRWFHLLIDIDDRKRAEAQLAGEKVLLELVASGSSLKHVLTSLCRFVEYTAADCKCGIYLIDWEGPTFHTGAAPSLPPSFNNALEGLAVTESAGPCGLAALTKSQVIAADFESDFHWQESLIRPLALAHGMRAHWSTPVCSRVGSVLATFAVFHDHPASPNQFHQDLIAQVTHIASIAIERTLNEEALRLSQRNLSLTIDTIPTFIQVSRPDGTILSVNQAVLDYHGVTLEEVQKEDFRFRFYHPDDAERVREVRTEALKRPVRFEYEQRALGKDGKYRWFLVRYNPRLDDQGRIERWYATAFDIEDRKVAEDELQRSKAFLAETQHLSSIGSFCWHVATDEITWSEQLYRIYEFEPGLKVTLDLIRTRVHPEDLTLYEKMLAQARNGAADFEWQYRLLMPDRSIKYMHAVVRATRNSEGELEYIAAVQDVTRRRLIEEELRRSEAFLAEGQHLARMGNFWWRVMTNEILWSEPMYRIFEFEPGTPMTLELIASRVHPDDMPSLHDMVERAQHGKDFEYEHRIVMPDGSVKYLHLIAHLTRDQERGPEYIGAVQDVTQRRFSEEALSRARSELAHVARVMSLGTLTASIAHEVNQPLSGIITNASTCVRMLDADPPNVDGARETAKRTIRDGRRAADVITRLRALFSKKEASTELVNLNEATQEVIALSRSELEQNRVIVRTQLADDLPLIEGDRVQLQQVILNLLRNGSDAMSTIDDRPRELLFRTEMEAGERVRLSVRDAGVGFETEALSQLFQSFYTTKDDGMGIGLSVSRSIIENHHGRLSATPNDGPGVTFSFSIPCAAKGHEQPFK
jgi:PAS domain S-box-containing protein